MREANDAEDTPENALDGEPPSFDETSLRVLNLFFALNASAAPLTTEQIVCDADMGYGSDNRESDRRKFMRDRERLAQHGVVIREVREVGASETEESSWEIDRGLTHADTSALTADDVQVALEAIDKTFVLNADNPERWPLQRAYLKLRELFGGAGTSQADAAASRGDAATGVYSPRLQELWRAFTQRKPARFTYRDALGRASERTVELYGTFTQGTHVYVVGLDRTANGMRTFRTDRIERVRKTAANAARYEMPEAFSAADYQFLPFDFSDAPEVPATFTLPASVPLDEVACITKGRGHIERTGDRYTWDVAVRDPEAAAAFALSYARLGLRPQSPQSLVERWREHIVRAAEVHHVA